MLEEFGGVTGRTAVRGGLVLGAWSVRLLPGESQRQRAGRQAPEGFGLLLAEPSLWPRPYCELRRSPQAPVGSVQCQAHFGATLRKPWGFFLNLSPLLRSVPDPICLDLPGP